MKLHNYFGIFARCVTICCVLAFYALWARADNSIQVIPFTLSSQVSADERCYFDVSISTEDPQQSFQFDLKVPKGMTIQNVTLCSLTSSSFNYDYDCIDREANIMRFICWSNNSDVILPALSGSVMRFYYTYSRPEDASGMLTPIVFNNSVIGSPMYEEESEESTSSFFLYTNGAELKSTDLDTKSLEGYLPSFVCDGIMDILEQDTIAIGGGGDVVKTLLLPYVTAVAKPIAPINKNAIVYCKPDSKAYNTILEARTSNVAKLTYDEYSRPVATIEKLVMYNEDLDFTRNFSFDFEASMLLSADTVELSRTFISDHYASLCLPFAVGKSAFAEYFDDNDIAVYQIADYDLSVPELTFKKVNSMRANTPYFVKFTGETTTLPAMNDMKVTKTSANNDNSIASDDVSIVLRGSYTATWLSSTDDTAYYAYDAATGEFKKAGQNVHAYPFRAYIIAQNRTEANALPATIKAVFEDEYVADGIDATRIDVRDGNASYTYNVSGQKVSDSYRGIVIRNGRKEIRR